MLPFFKKQWPLMGVAILVAVVAFYLVQARKNSPHRSVGPDAPTEEGLKLEDVHFTQDSPDDKVKWVLDAEEARLSKDKEVVSFHRFRLRLEPDKRPYVELVGERGEYHRTSGEIRLNGNLKGTTEDGYSIVTESAVYMYKQGRLETKDPVKVTGPFFSVEGRGLQLNVKKETVQVLSDVTTLIQREFPVL
jgi:LPS export ABC transporter protein LptC